MRRILVAMLLATAAGPLAAQSPVSALPVAVSPKPAALDAQDVPPVPLELVAKTRPYLESRSAGFAGWDPKTRAVLIATRFGNTSQLHRVATPLGARTQISFEAEPVSGAYAPDKGDVIVVQKDTGGDEYYQLYTLASGRLTLLTDGKSRNEGNAWSEDGELVGFSSTRRNGADSDLYVMNPRDPASSRMVAQVKGGGWGIAAFAPDKSSAIVANYQSVQDVDLYRLDLASGSMTPMGDNKLQVAQGGVQVAPDGTIWLVSDAGSDFARLGTLDPGTGKFTPRGPAEKWDVDGFDMSKDGKTIAYIVNEAGAHRMRILDVPTGATRTVETLPAGVISGLEIAPWGEIGFSMSSARSASDVWSVDPSTLAVTRWTQSETGGLDVKRNSEPEIVTVKSFDKLPVSGLLYLPDPARFPGPRPLIVSVHGGPEGQSQAGFLGRNNYLLNELGIGIFLPNVRGSTGYGKRFVSLDNGPFKREDSVRDLGAMIDALRKDSRIDPARVGLTGGSYGGYMCYAAAVQLKDRLRATQCTVAISNFVSFLENTNAYRRDLRRVEYGDERDPRQRAQLMKISPLTRVGEITKPMFVITGANDPRVPKSEADQMVAAIRAKGGEAWHLVAANEGHGYAKKENVDYAFWSALQFWQRYLLGQ
ncbi:prolyl oligopeptidase family serine peptidase [Novosphingobium tardum]|uniref:Prolyl oligopeptidase family serine peptidase n=1 Tax=Novosphingobium tardum TaxID=1538021 RepID=A0ABV8RMK0_9SPHN